MLLVNTSKKWKIMTQVSVNK